MEVPPVVPPVSAEDSAKPEAEPAGAEPAAETNNNKRGREEDGEGADVDQMRKRPSFVTPSDAEPPGVEAAPAAAAAGSSEEITETIMCPQSLVGKLIGRDGVTIRDLQIRTNTRIQVDQKAPGEEKPVTIQGGADNVRQARTLIDITLSSETGASLPGDVFDTVECPQEFVGRIIGRAGETIRTLQSASGAHIVVKQDFPEGMPRHITANGRPDAVERAVKMIRELIAGGTSTQEIIRKYGQGASKAMTCPKSLVGKLIGKGGETIKNLQKTSGASIQIDQNTDPCGVTITGQNKAVNTAYNMVRDLIQQAQAFAGMPGGMPGMGGYGMGGYGAPGAGRGAGRGAPMQAPGYGGYGYGAPGAYGGAPGGYGGAPAGGYGGYGAGGGYGGAAADPYAAGGYGGGYGQQGAGGYAGAGGAGGYGGYGQQAGAAGGYGGAAGGGYGGGYGGAPAQSAWSEVHDAEGRPYYYNSQTGVSQWEKPADMA